MKNFLLFLCFYVFLSIPSQLGAQCINNDPTVPVGITPTTIAFPGGDPVCPGGYGYRFSDDGDYLTPGVTRTFTDSKGNTISISVSSGSCGEILTWTSTGSIVVDKVFAKGSTTQNVYDYTGESPQPTTDGNIHSPVNASGGFADFSHIDFCYHYVLDVSKTAVPGFTRSYTWKIDKTCDGPSSLTLSPGQIYNYPFSYKVEVDYYTDNNWQVSGNITITNNTPTGVELTSISDVLTGGINADLVCNISFPYLLASGATLNCSYSASLASAQNGTNTVTATTNSTLVRTNSGTADYTFGAPTTLVDDCVTVTDNCNQPVSVCVNDAPKTVSYNCPVSYAACGNYTFTNTAGFVTNTTQATGSDNCNITVSVPCAGGCTLTIGYWKTHSSFGPAPYDDTWALLSNGASTTFFLSGRSYYQVLWTAPAGNAYYNLAQQYIAASLNVMNGASSTSVTATLASALTLLSTYTPAQVAALSPSNATRKQFVNLAAILDNYNKGLIGPGHCSEATNRVINAAPEIQRTGTAQEGVKLWPNPSSSSFILRVESAGGSLPVQLRVFDVTGRQVYKANSITNNNLTFGQQLAPGVYLAEITRDGVRSTVKLMKE